MALSPDQPFVLEKPVWSEADFERMGWHDVVVHATAIDPEHREFVMDIDYLFGWVNPEPPSQYYSFWAAPCTLIFRHVHDLQINIQEPMGLQIMSVERTDPKATANPRSIADQTLWKWTVELLSGEIKFYSTGYMQYTRQIPVRLHRQHFSLAERGGCGFERTTEPLGG